MRKLFKYKAVTFVAVLTTLTSNGVTAQDNTVALEELVVKGIRGSLRQSLDVKRSSDQVVDAITSEDVGKFPDKNIADALQRITGVAIDRSGGEGQFITVRGLGPEFNTVLVNGRTMATDNNGREFSFDVLSSDIISSAQVFKTPVANLQEGGIGATVNIVTARPLSLATTGFTGSVSGVYGSLDGEVSPEVSGTYSYRNDDSTFGAVASLSYSDRSTQIDVARIDGFIQGPQNTILGNANSTGLNNADQAALPNINTPRNLVFDRNQTDRERVSANLTLQSRPSDSLEITFDALYSEFNIDSQQNLITPFFTQPFIGIETNGNGTVTGFNRPGQDFLANNPDLGIGLSQNDNVVSATDRQAKSSQLGLNFKWNVTDALTVTADLSTSQAERRELVPFVVIGSLATTAPRFNLNPQNDIPEITNQGVLTDAGALRHHFSQLRRRFLDDDIVEARLEGDWEIDRGALNNVSFGALFSQREKVFINQRTPASVRCAYCGYNLAIDPSIVSPIAFDGYLPDASGSPRPVGFDYDPFAVLAFLGRPENINDPARQPGLSPADFAANAAAILARGSNPFDAVTEAGSSFDVTEDVLSLFVSGSFSGELGGVPWSGNIGARYSRTDVSSVGQDNTITSITQAAGDDLLIFNTTPLVDVRVDSDYSNFLPSANIKFELADDKVLRFAAAQTVTRPTLDTLGTNNSFQGRVTNPLSSGGNPELEPFESTSFDASYEWYYADASYFGASFFHKEFDNFLESQTLPVVRQFTDNNGVTRPITFNDTRTRNGEEGTITGAEIALQHNFDNGFGVLANYTYVTSDVERVAGSAAADCDYNGLSPNTVNLAGYYENDRFQIRVAYNWRDEFLQECFSNASRPRNTEAFGQLDFSAAYNLSDTYQVFFSGVNVTDEVREQFSVLEERFLDYEDTRARYTLGVRGSF